MKNTISGYSPYALHSMHGIDPFQHHTPCHVHDVVVVAVAGGYRFQGHTPTGLRAILQASVEEGLQAGQFNHPALQARAIQHRLEQLGCTVVHAARVEEPICSRSGLELG